MEQFNWTVASDITRLYLTDDQREWIEVKHELTWGERKALAAAGLRKLDQQQQIDVDWDAFDVQKILTWVVDWSARDANGKPLALNEANVRALHPKVGDLIVAKIDEHVESLEGNASSPETPDTSTETIAPLTPLHSR